MASAISRPANNTASNLDGLEMSLRQRALVDTCFEEGQYESAISALEQQRSPVYKPSVSHVRQLIYIALHHISDAQPEKTSKSLYDSPGKSLQFTRTPLSSAAVATAQQLLFSFAATQNPDSLARALPCYEPLGGAADNAAEDAGDSDISREALCIGEAKDCWSILVEGFLSKGKVLFSTPKRKSRRRHDSFEGRIDSEASPNRDIVGQAAWPVLGWILTLFEQDERLTMSKEEYLYSPLLLRQIPPTRSSSGVRWDVDAPLAIVVFSLQQSDFQRQRLGLRLMTLLANLSLTPFLDFPIFIGSVFGRLSTATPERLYLLLSSLPPLPSIHQFKVALCYKFIREDELNPGRPGANEFPFMKPLARAFKPRSKRPDQSQVMMASVTPVSAFKHLPPGEAIISALENRIPSIADAGLQIRIKFELFFSYGTIQNGITEEEKDQHWTNAIRQAKLNDILNVAFDANSGEGALKFRTLAQSVLPLWS